MNKNKTIGLIGGMGPYASNYFYKLMLDKAGSDYSAKNNSDYPEIVIDSVPIPDFISDTKNLEISKNILTNRLEKLEKFGCTDIAMICNTAHILAGNFKTKNFVSIIDLACLEAKNRCYKKVGILTTPTTRKYNLYGKALEKLGIEYVYINGEIEKAHEKIIREVISGNASKIHGKKLYEIAQKFIKENKLDGLILGCTELPLIFPKNKFDNIIDCLDVLANELLFRYYQGG